MASEDIEINLISLIDVLMVLLIFFMLCSTFVDEGRMNLQLPTASEEGLRHQRRRAHRGDGDGAGRLPGQRARAGEMPAAIPLRRAVEQVAGKERDGRVVLRADARATHQSVVTAMDVLGRMGFAQLNIATIQPAEGQ